jgi:hypothetical protein
LPGGRALCNFFLLRADVLGLIAEFEEEDAPETLLASEGVVPRLEHESFEEASQRLYAQLARARAGIRFYRRQLGKREREFAALVESHKRAKAETAAAKAETASALAQRDLCAQSARIENLEYRLSQFQKSSEERRATVHQGVQGRRSIVVPPVVHHGEHLPSPA